MTLALVGDIGGTNARFALWENDALHSVQVFSTADYTSPEQAIGEYFKAKGLALGAVGQVCLSVAGPVDGDEFRFTNNHWRLSQKAFCKTLQVAHLRLVNDFTAMALGMTRLKEGEYRSVREGRADPSRPAVVIGPGTGLGVGTLLNLGEGRWMALPGEGGHVDLPVGNAREARLRQHIEGLIGHVSAETVLSGGGLLRLYQTICAVDAHVPKFATPAEVTQGALGGDPVALQTIDQFARFLARVAANNVLTVGGRGGVYIVGGVIPHFIELFLNSGFNDAFDDKGCMSDYFEGIPVWVVTAQFSGLIGAGVALGQP
ncbi:glucokinase [Pseudomonas typographi]|uniref:Glucokinase n=1 Tax=Pseudomonas typographi TaxID=2715964 RepID=A0ABR7YXK8_9PSED|nr:glucokinase [Pseudomonas typographi]MBD1585790.1 glucokinase [Pseudomonas typographi]MBD1597864.1 glucokinase [Pseudomonas typographi]